VSAKKRVEGRQAAPETFPPVALAHGAGHPDAECSTEERERQRLQDRRRRTRGDRDGE